MCQGISLKLLKPRGRQLCEHSIGRLTSQNVRLILPAWAQLITSQLKKKRVTVLSRVGTM